MRRADKWIVIAVATAFFCGPAALIAVGERARPFENHGLAPRPQLAAHWAFFQEMTDYLVDHLPFRAQAVKANSWVLENVFGTTPQYGVVPAPSATGTLAAAVGGVQSGGPALSQTQVIRGRDGWLFFGFPLDLACQDPLANVRALGRWEALLALLHEYGRRAVLVVAPEKSTIYPELVPTSDPTERCGRTASLAMWRAIEGPTAVGDGIIGLRRPLLRLKSETRGPIYIPTDTHWNGIGSLTFAATVVPKLDRKLRLTSADVVPTTPIREVTDLSRFEGTPMTAVVPDRAVQRQPGAPKLSGPTLVIGDSFLGVALAQLQPFLAKTYVAIWNGSIAKFAADMAAARTVVLETVERAVALRGDLITPEFLRLLRADLIRAGDRRTHR